MTTDTLMASAIVVVGVSAAAAVDRHLSRMHRARMHDQNNRLQRLVSVCTVAASRLRVAGLHADAREIDSMTSRSIER